MDPTTRMASSAAVAQLALPPPATPAQAAVGCLLRLTLGLQIAQTMGPEVGTIYVFTYLEP